MITSTLRGRIIGAAITTIVASATLASTYGPAIGPAQAATRAAGASQPAAHLGQQITSTHPPGREWPSFAYDPGRHQFVLFGGERNGTLLGDTWTRSHGIWTQQHPARHPSPRAGTAIAYNGAFTQLLLFGGSLRNGSLSNQTWSWGGTTWWRIRPPASPPARRNASMIYEAGTGRVILFGGWDGTKYLNDTWAWNGTWTQLHPATSPSPRESASLVYDYRTKTESTILFGGSTSTGRLNDTWSWDGTTWTQLYPAISPGAINTAWQAATDATSGQPLLFGGDPGNGDPPLNQTWAWTGTTWTQLHPATSPPGRTAGSMTYNPTTGRIVLFGGQGSQPGSYPTTTWRWDGTNWHRAG